MPAGLDKLVRWQDWKLPVKLAAVTLIPIVIAVALGVSALTSQGDRIESYDRINRLTVLSTKIGLLLDGLQRERTETAARLTKGTGASTALDKARAQVDSRTAPVRDAADRSLELAGGIGGSVQESEDLLGRLQSIRADATAGKLDPVQAIAEYSAITESLLKLDAATVARISDEAIGGTAQALHDVRAAKEEVTSQQALVSFGIARGVLTPSELAQVRIAEVRIEDRMARFDAEATPAQREVLANTVSEPSSKTRARIARGVLGELGTPSDLAVQQLSESDWNNSSRRVGEQLGMVAMRLGTDATAISGGLLSDTRTSVTILAVLLLLAMLLAVGVVWVITRHLLHSLKVLRNAAMRTAEERLPEAVRGIQEGKGSDTSIEPVPVRTNDEIGEVARAFDAVHNQALRLAVEQASMRTAYGTVFVNLSRRSQSLVQRQLQLIERLERDEEDADQLATLFQLDHLATRMRRNNENLMVLSGAEGSRRSGRPVSTADVLRAAVSEIEQYQRVVVQSPPTTKVVGHAASDLMRLIAELLDNATAFSPPETKVTVSTSVGHSGSMTIDILDKGIGMNAAEVAEANERMREAHSLDLVTSRRMGLFVVGRLASRHGLDVTLYGGKDIEGVRATVTVPAELVLGTEGGPLTSEMPIITDAGPLPRRGPDSPTKSLSGFGGPKTPGQQGATLPRPRKSGPETNGTAAVPPQSENEMSGTALFNPITDEGANGNTSKPDAANGVNGALPKRGGKNGAKPKSAKGTAKAAGAADGELPSGKDLFQASTPLSEWWSAAAADSAKPKAESASASSSRETTPIFDEMLSVWFRTDGTEPEKAGAKDAKKKTESWDFAADKNWKTVQEVSKAAPSSFTEAGLPRRNRGELLLPGSATPEPEPTTRSRSAMGRAELPPRDAADIRSRLSGFQRGVKRGKHEAGKHAQPEVQVPGANGAKPDANGTKPPVDVSAADRKADDTGSWKFDSDAVWQTAKAVADSKPETYTESGLPRRRRGEQLLPGSASGVPSAAAVKAPQPERDPDAMRGRLSSFQQGVRRARHTTTTQATDSKKMEGE